METIRIVAEEKRAYLPLLLEADPDEAMIGRYLERGRMYVMECDARTVAVAVTAAREDGNCELKNIAVDSSRRHHGYGSRLLRHVMEAEAQEHSWMFVGTTAPTEPFYM